MSITQSFVETLKQIVIDSQTGVIFEMSDSLDACGEYNVELNKVQINWENISKDAEKYSKRSGLSISAESFALMVVAHELGHAVDKELPANNLCIKKSLSEVESACLANDKQRFKKHFKKVASLTMEKERTAWALAKGFYPYGMDSEAISVCSAYCLQSYTDMIRMEYKFYLTTIKLVPFLLQLEKFFPSDYGFTFEFSATDRFQVNEKRRKIHIPIARNLLLKRHVPYVIDRLSFVVFDTMLEYLKWEDKEHLSVIEQLDDDGYAAYEKGEDLAVVLNLLDEYASEQQNWFENAFSKMRPFLADLSDSFDTYSNHTLRKSARLIENLKKFYVNEYKKKTKTSA